MTVSISNVSLPAASSLIAVASDGTQLWQAILSGFDNSGTLANDSILKPHPVQTVPRFVVNAASAMTRPANVTAYSAGDLIANNATAASVVATTWTVTDLNDAPVALRSILSKTTDTGIAGFAIRMYLYNSDPTASTGVANGDNGVFSVKTSGYIGTMSGVYEATADGCVAVLTPDQADPMITAPTSGAQTIFGLRKVLAAFTPSANSTTFTDTIRAEQGRA